jgi:hypothetical protein
MVAADVVSVLVRWDENPRLRGLPLRGKAYKVIGGGKAVVRAQGKVMGEEGMGSADRRRGGLSAAGFGRRRRRCGGSARWPGLFARR